MQEGGGTEGEMLRPQLLPERVCTLPPPLRNKSQSAARVHQCGVGAGRTPGGNVGLASVPSPEAERWWLAEDASLRLGWST